MTPQHDLAGLRYGLLRPAEYLTVVAAAFAVEVAAITGPRRHRPIVEARHTAAYCLQAVYRRQLSQTAIGALLGQRDNSTITHAIQMVSRRLAADPAYAARITDLIAIGRGTHA